MTDRLPHEKGFHVSWDQIHRDARALAWRLDGKGPGEGAWKAVVGITRGGLVPAMIVSRELDIRVVDTISVKSYHSGGGAADQRSEAQVIKSPQADLMGDGTGILIVDDLVDSGKTLELVRRLYPKAHFATRLCQALGQTDGRQLYHRVSARTPGSSSPGTWRCNMSSPCAGKTDPCWSVPTSALGHMAALAVRGQPRHQGAARGR